MKRWQLNPAQVPHFPPLVRATKIPSTTPKPPALHHRVIDSSWEAACPWYCTTTSFLLCVSDSLGHNPFSLTRNSQWQHLESNYSQKMAHPVPSFICLSPRVIYHREVALRGKSDCVSVGSPVYYLMPALSRGNYFALCLSGSQCRDRRKQSSRGQHMLYPIFGRVV